MGGWWLIVPVLWHLYSCFVFIFVVVLPQDTHADAFLSKNVQSSPKLWLGWWLMLWCCGHCPLMTTSKGVVCTLSMGHLPIRFCFICPSFCFISPSNLLHFPNKLLHLPNKLLHFPNRLLHFPNKILTLSNTHHYFASLCQKLEHIFLIFFHFFFKFGA